MGRQLTEHDGRVALVEHVRAKAALARDRLQALGGADAIMRLLEDRSVVRYPVGVRFDDGPLEPGEFAYPAPLGDHPAAGYCLFIHPRYERKPETWPPIIAYYIPTINYGEVATEAEAEEFGAGLLGMTRNQYYAHLCSVADLR